MVLSGPELFIQPPCPCGFSGSGPRTHSGKLLACETFTAGMFSFKRSFARIQSGDPRHGPPFWLVHAPSFRSNLTRFQIKPHSVSVSDQTLLCFSFRSNITQFQIKPYSVSVSDQTLLSFGSAFNTSSLPVSDKLLTWSLPQFQISHSVQGSFLQTPSSLFPTQWPWAIDLWYLKIRHQSIDRSLQAEAHHEDSDLSDTRA